MFLTHPSPLPPLLFVLPLLSRLRVRLQASSYTQLVRLMLRSHRQKIDSPVTENPTACSSSFALTRICRRLQFVENIILFVSNPPLSLRTAIIISHEFYPQLREHQLPHYKRGTCWKNEDNFHSGKAGSVPKSFSVLPCSF